MSPVRKLILTGTTIGWLLCIAGFGFLAWAAATDDRDCTTEDPRFVESADAESYLQGPPLTEGTEEWSWLPPGMACRYTVERNGFDETRSPGPWFTVGVIGMLASGAGLVYTRLQEAAIEEEEAHAFPR